MIDTIVVNAAPGETRLALLAGGRVVEVTHHRLGGESIAGNVYLGRVTGLAAGLDAAFVDIGVGSAGFLNASDARPDPDAAVEPIGRYVHQGEAVVVQVSRDPIGGKGPRLTMRPAMVGRGLVYLPGQRRIEVSRRIAGAAERERLLRLVGDAAGGDEGFILRSAAADAGDDEILGEIATMRRLWKDAAARRATPPALLLAAPGPLERALRDNPGVERVVLDTAAALAEAKRLRGGVTLEPYRGAEPVFEHFGIEAALEGALEARVPLPSGGAVVIEETEALCAIDVDTAGHGGGHGSGETALAANLEAAEEIARQLRLRGIGGIIVIDFVHMAKNAQRRKVIAALRGALGGDRDAVAPGGFTRLGLVEMRRRRTRPSLAEQLGGPRRSARTLALDIARRAAREAVHAPAGALTLTLADEVAGAVDDALREALAEATGRAVEVVAQAAYGRAEHDVDFG